MRDIILLTGVVLVAAILMFTGCTQQKEWTAYQRVPDDHAIVDGQLVNVGSQTKEQMQAKDEGCKACHLNVGDPHARQSNFIACVDCHGGNAAGKTKEEAHPKPRHPEAWMRNGKMSSANPEHSFALLNDENPEWIRFVNPGDLRVANEACGGCHQAEFINVSKSLMTTAAHFWGVAPYCNGIVPFKRSALGESYSREGIGQKINLVTDPPMTPEQMANESVSPFLLAMPRFEVFQPGNILRVFERGSRLPNPAIGLPDKEEEPGLPNNRLSERGLGTQLRIDFPVLNVHKTRLNDPHLSFLGTNDNPGDFRSSGCSACHMVYANDRSPIHSGPFAKYGNRGLTSPSNPDPTIPKDEPGHPIAHAFTKSAPSSQCMVCHMHQPNSFVNSYYGFTMWTYETDGDVPGKDGRALWPKEGKHPTHEELVESFLRNPEEAAARGNWIEPEFLAESSSINANAKHTQFADYHGHGWMFRAVFKMDRVGNLLDAGGDVVPYDDPDKFKGVIPLVGALPGEGSGPGSGAGGSTTDSDPHAARRAVHLKDIHAEVGMHCSDCHFLTDSHGNGKLYHEYQAAIEITCRDCHGTVREYANLKGPPTGPAASDASAGLGDMKTPEGDARFEWKDGQLIQRSMVEAGKWWAVSQVKDAVTPGNANWNEKAAWAKTVRADGSTWGAVDDKCKLAHNDDKMECYSCHTSWITSCFGCHLPQRGNIKVKMKHYEGDTLRNFATYNPQVVRDSEFMLGVAGDVKGNRIAPVRSSSAVMISSEDSNRRWIYLQQPTISAPGYSSQAFNTHFPHTVRRTETKTCDDCHLSANEDNNAWLAQAYLLGTNSVGLMGHYAYVGEGKKGFLAVQVTEYYEPQAVIGSNLHRIAWPEEYHEHQERGKELDHSHHHDGVEIQSVQHRGEYLYTAAGAGGFRVYDIANVAHKDFSEPLVTAPVSPLGQDTHVETTYATAVRLGFNNPISMNRTWRPENKEVRPPEASGKDFGYLHPLYRYAYITDRYEGLILVDVDCLADGDPQNNFLERAVTFNPDGILDGAENLTVAGETVYICCRRGLVAVDIRDPLNPKVVSEIGAPHIDAPTAVDVQFRYAFVTDAAGLKVLDVTWPERMGDLARQKPQIPTLPIADARDVYVAKTYAYVSAGAEGMVIADVTRPLDPRKFLTWNDDGKVDDLNEIKVATTNDSMFAYLADGKNGLKVVQIVSPGDGEPRSPYGWSPRPVPPLVAEHPTDGSATCVSKALDRDRAVDESGNQVAVFGRIGGRPMNLAERERFYLRKGALYRVTNQPTTKPVQSEASAKAPAERPSKPASSGGGH